MGELPTADALKRKLILLMIEFNIKAEDIYQTADNMWRKQGDDDFLSVVLTFESRPVDETLDKVNQALFELLNLDPEDEILFAFVLDIYREEHNPEEALRKIIGTRNILKQLYEGKLDWPFGDEVPREEFKKWVKKELMKKGRPRGR